MTARTATCTAAAVGLVVWAARAGRLAQLLEALGVLDPQRITITEVAGDVDDALVRLSALEVELARLVSNWPEPIRHAAATRAFDRLVGGGS